MRHGSDYISFEQNAYTSGHYVVPTKGFTFGNFFEQEAVYRFHTAYKPGSSPHWLINWKDWPNFVPDTYVPTTGTKSFKFYNSTGKYKIQLISIEVHENIDLTRWNELCTIHHNKTRSAATP